MPTAQKDTHMMTQTAPAVKAALTHPAHTTAPAPMLMTSGLRRRVRAAATLADRREAMAAQMGGAS